jgi:uncharacterized protein
MSIETWVFVAGVFFVAGWVKGVVGLGLPTVAMGALGLVMPPVQAAALLVLPSLATNLWQFLAGPAIGPLIKRLFWLLALVCVGTDVGVRLLTGPPSPWPGVALGLVLLG